MIKYIELLGFTFYNKRLFKQSYLNMSLTPNLLNDRNAHIHEITMHKLYNPSFKKKEI